MWLCVCRPPTHRYVVKTVADCHAAMKRISRVAGKLKGYAQAKLEDTELSVENAEADNMSYAEHTAFIKRNLVNMAKFIK